MATNKNGLTEIFVPFVGLTIGYDNHDYPAKNSFETARSLSKYDAIWDGSAIKEHCRDSWDILKKEYHDTLILMYCASDSTKRAEDGWLDYNYINTVHPEWFVLKDAVTPASSDPAVSSNRIAWITGDPGDGDPEHFRYYLDVCNTEFQDWAANEILDVFIIGNDKTLAPFDGIALDNVNIGTYRTSGLTNSYPNWTYAGIENVWNSGFIQYLRKIKSKLHSKGFLVAVNHNLWSNVTEDNPYNGIYDPEWLWNDLIHSVDILATERALKNEAVGDVAVTGQQWLICLEREDMIQRNNKINWWITTPWTGSQQKEFSYIYGSWLLIKNDKSLFHANKDNLFLYSSEVPWYSEYNYDLGNPLSARYELSGLWCRKYEKGLVAVNPTPDSHNIFATGYYYIPNTTSIDNNATYTVPSTSGLILQKYMVYADPF
jgi:hypothetical protein